MNQPAPVLILGLGNRFRGDDGAGLVATQRLRALHLPNVTVREESGEGAALIEAWEGAAAVILIDAAQSGAAPGTIHRLDPHEMELPSRFFRYSTHAFSVAEAIELARVFKQLPPRLSVYGIEGCDFAAAPDLSPQVDSAMDELVRRVRLECAALQSCSVTPLA